MLLAPTSLSRSRAAPALPLPPACQERPCWRRRAAPPPRAAAEPRADRSVDISGAPEAEGAPWSMGFQCNERYLKWDDSAQRQLILIWVAQQLDVSMGEVEARVAELALLLPDLAPKLSRLQAKLVLALVSDLPGVTARILALREVLPSLDLAALLAQYPWMLTKLSPEQAQAALGRLAAELPPGVAVERLVAAEPMLLLADIQAVLAELRRLLPGQDPAAALLADPSGCLDMQSAGLKASLEIDDGIKQP